MSTIEQIEEAVRKLSPEQRAEFRAWFAAFDADQWDRQFEEDAGSGRLDWLVDEAMQEKRAGNGTCG